MKSKKKGYIDDIQDCIKCINSAFKDYFDSPIKLEGGPFRYYAKGPDMDTAINRFEPVELVDVVKWFDDIYYYISISFQYVVAVNRMNISVSMSFFQGGQNDHEKYQLFRAEWDSYQGVDIQPHPQPHWHITTGLPLERCFSSLLESANTNNEVASAISLLNEEKKKIIDINKFHFTMRENFREKVEISPEKLANWMKNIFSHVRDEIVYLSK